MQEMKKDTAHLQDIFQQSVDMSNENPTINLKDVQYLIKQAYFRGQYDALKAVQEALPDLN